MRRWELSALPPQSPGKAGLEIEFNHQWSMIESITPMQWNLHKTLQMCQGLKSFWVGERINVLGGWWALKGCGSYASYHLCTSSIWLFLSYNLYNKLANLSKVLSWVLWVVLADSWTWGGGGGHANPWIYSHMEAQWPGTGTWYLKGKQSCGTEPLACGACANSR